MRGERRRTGDGRRVYQHAEIAWGPFERRLRLGVAVDPSAATAAYRTGILRIMLPLAAAAAAAAGRDHGAGPVTTDAGTEEPTPRVQGGEVDEPAEEPEGALPETLPVLPLKETVVFPEAVAPLAVGEERSIRLIDEVLNGPDRLLALVVSRDPEVSEPGPDQLHEIGTVAVVQRMVRVPDGTVRILAQGLRRVRLGPYTQTEPFLGGAAWRRCPTTPSGPPRSRRSRGTSRASSRRMIELVPHLPDELQIAVANMEDPTTLSYVIAASMRLSVEERQELLEESDLAARLRRLTVLCHARAGAAGAGGQDPERRPARHRQGPARVLPAPAAQGDPRGAGRGRRRAGRDRGAARAQLAEVDPPEEVRAAAERELSRLERLPQASAEYGVVRTYLDWILSLPWNTITEDDLDLTRARAVLDEDHYDIEKVKDRIIEHLAVARLKQRRRRPDPVLRGPARGRQDVARASRSRGPWGGASRASRWAGVRDESGDPRPPAHLRRRDARHDRARDPRRRRHEPGDDGGRDRQDGLRLPGRPRLGDARGARPGPERDLPGPLPRPAARPVAGALPVHGRTCSRRSRPRCSTGWR